MAKQPSFPTLYDDVKRICISDLKRLNYLIDGSYKSGFLTWNRAGYQTGGVGISVNMRAEEPYLELDYRLNGHQPVNYRVSLVKLSSNLGKGNVWYFVCPRTGKRCRILYLVDTHFLHREAFDGAMYDCQTQSKNWRSFRTLLNNLDRNRRPIRTHYNGKLTRRFKRWLERTEQSAVRMAEYDFDSFE